MPFWSKALILSLLTSSVALAAPTSTFRAECTGLLLSAPFVKPHKWIKSLAKRLLPPDARALQELGWRWNSQTELDRLAAKFQFGVVRTKLELYTDPKNSRTHAELLFSFYNSEKDPNGLAPIAVAAYVIQRLPNGELEADVDSFYLDLELPELDHLSAYTRTFMDQEVYAPLGVLRETIFTDYVGRYAWAKAGYRFNPRTYYWPKGKIVKGGETLKSVEMIRENLAVFLRYRGIKITDLVVKLPNEKSRTVKSLEDLNEPIDFASLHHVKGHRFVVAPLVAENRLGEPVAMPVGKAFMLSDYRPIEGQAVIRSQMGTKFRTYAMPKWRGVRDLR